MPPGALSSPLSSALSNPPSSPLSKEARLAKEARLDALISDLGPRIRRGGRISEHAAQKTWATGIPETDRLLDGGFPLGALCEISGGASSGRTSLALALLARATDAGERVAWVDGADAFDPLSAERLGVDLDRVLWVRARAPREALRSSERLLATDGFPLVLLDWANGAAPTSAWIRLHRLATSTRTTLLLLSAERLTGSNAALALQMQGSSPHFTGTPSLLEGLESKAVLVRNRRFPHESAA